MRYLKNLLAIVFVLAACWCQHAFSEWNAIKTFVISPSTGYTVSVVMISVLLFLSGFCFGGNFSRRSNGYVVVGLFAVCLILQACIPFIGAVSVNESYAILSEIVVQTKLFTYVLAVYAGILLGSRTA